MNAFSRFYRGLRSNHTHGTEAMFKELDRLRGQAAASRYRRHSVTGSSIFQAMRQLYLPAWLHRYQHPTLGSAFGR